MKKYLLGATKDREIVFAEFAANHPEKWNQDKVYWIDESIRQFSASFCTVIPFTENDLEDPIYYYEELLTSFDDAEKFHFCEQYDCTPSELVENFAYENGIEPIDIKDCSLYPNVIKVDDINYYFESSACGQHDTRKNDMMDEYVNKEAYDLLHELWDNYHLKVIDKEGLNKMQKVVELLENVDEEEWIKDYIERKF